MCIIALLALTFLSATAFGQGGAASLTGTIQDASGGVLPGASVAARNVDTGIVTRTTSSDRGSYNFPNLPVGAYELTVEATGFQRTTRTGIRLTVGATGRLDVSLEVAGTVTEIAVTGTVESVILEAGTSTGTVMSDDVLQAIPMVGNNVMDLINILGGVTMNTSDAVWGGLSQEFAGVNSRQVNIMRDGMSMNEVRYATGINAASNINQEMVGEFKMVLSPVDAEMGRGAGQVQMTTRSGSNVFHGSGTWSNQNTALDARDFSHKLNNTPKMWRNLNNYMLTGSGPIIRNKAFFFVTWEQQFSRSKTPVTAKVMTECAKKGIYRYIYGPNPAGTTPDMQGWQPGPATESNTYNPTTNTRPSVDMDGNILLGGNFYNSATNTPVSFPNGELKFESVFGPLDRTASWWSQFTNPSNEHGVYGDCEVLPFNGMNGQFGTTSAWDTRNWGTGTGGGRAYRYQYDPTGFVDRFTSGIAGKVQMPPVNNYLVGDGLNYAGHRWTRAVTGEGGYQEGTGGDPNRKAITFKIDYNINNDHRLSGTYSYEHHRIDDSWQNWPSEYGGYGGSMSRKPQSFLVSLISTLRPTLLNEFRFGLTRPYAMTDAPIDWKHRDSILELMNGLLPTGAGSPYFGGTQAQDLEILLSAGEGQAAFYNDNYGGIGAANTSHWYGGGYIRDSWGGYDPRWTTADTITWMKGSHSFKGGIEWRRQKSVQDATGTHSGPGFGGGGLSGYPLVYGGAITSVGERRRGILGQYAAGGANDDGVSWRGLPPNAQDNGSANAQSTVYTTPLAMMTYFSGAISNTRQWFFQVPDSAAPNGSRWNQLALGETLERNVYKNQEIHMFFKDDWRVTNDLTLNLGVRWEYYGVPHAEGGKSLGLVGGSTRGAFGISEPGFEHWMKNRTYVKTAPGVRPDPVTAYQYIGPGSDHPDVMLFNRDLNNFAPHLGFSYQLPWFGKGLTVLRGGWSVSYGQINTFDQFAVSLRISGAAVPSYMANYGGHGDRFLDDQSTAYYMDITDLSSILPLNGDLVSDLFNVYPMRPFQVGRFGSSVSAHDENIRNPHTNNFNMSLTRNIGRSLTVDVRYIGTMSRDQIPSPSTFNLNQGNFIDNNLQNEFEIVRQGGQSAVINSIIPTGALIAGATLTGSDQLRATNSTTYSALAAGTFSSIAATLATTPGTIPTSFAGEQGQVARSGCLPEDRQGYMNAFKANPNTLVQMNDATYPCEYGTPWNYFYTNPQNGTAWTYNANLGNYHSMQVQATLRPTRGLSFQATYTWSRNLSNSGWTNYVGERDYTLGGQHRTHALNTYGTYELPLGANGFVFRDAAGVFKKAVEGWQLSWITAMSSGQPINASGASTMWNNSYSVLVRPDLWDEKGGRTSETWDGDRFIGGKYFGDKYMKVMDRGICNSNEMYGDVNTANTLYNQYCERIYQTGGAWAYELRSTAPRALAVASGQIDSAGNMLPLRYSSLGEALKYDPNAQMDLVGVNRETGEPIYENPPVIVFRNANQIDYNGGQYIGNYKAGRVTGPGFFTFDMAMQKSIEFMEGKRLEFRVDAKNILNHATPTASTSASYGGRFMSISAPSVAIGGTTVFGNLPLKAGHRTFQARLSLRF